MLLPRTACRGQFAPDSPLEESGFEPSVARGTTEVRVIACDETPTLMLPSVKEGRPAAQVVSGFLPPKQC